MAPAAQPPGGGLVSEPTAGSAACLPTSGSAPGPVHPFSILRLLPSPARPPPPPLRSCQSEQLPQGGPGRDQPEPALLCPLLGQKPDVQGDSPSRWSHQPSAPACSWSQAEGNQGAGEVAGRVWSLTQPLGELRPGMKPCLTTLSRHLQAAVLGAPCPLGDEPRVPVCSEPLGTGEVAQPQVADKL